MMAYGTVSALVKKIVTDVTDPIIAASLVFTTGTALVALISLPRLKREIPQFTFRRVWLLVLGGTMMSLGILFFLQCRESRARDRRRAHRIDCDARLQSPYRKLSHGVSKCSTDESSSARSRSYRA